MSPRGWKILPEEETWWEPVGSAKRLPHSPRAAWPPRAQLRIGIFGSSISLRTRASSSSSSPQAHGMAGSWINQPLVSQLTT